MLELHVADTDVSGGSIAVSWCIDKELVQHLQKQKCLDPQLVLCIAPEDYHGVWDETRKVVPLKDMLAYLEFRKPGPHKIFAYISFGQRRQVKNAALEKSHRKYENWILDSEGENYAPSITGREDYNLCVAQPVSVTIPEECFAKRPHSLEFEYVNSWFATSPEDQCEFRRRRLFAYSAGAVLMLLNMLWRVCSLLLASLYLARNMTFKFILHPLKYNLSDDNWEVFCGGSYLIRRIPEPHHGTVIQELKWIVKKLMFLPLAPGFVIPIALLWYYNKLLVAGEICGFILILAVIVGSIGFFATKSYFTVFDYLWSLYTKYANTNWFNDQQEIDRMICTGEKKPTSLSQIPLRKLSIRLIYQGVKNKVCKPFSK